MPTYYSNTDTGYQLRLVLTEQSQSIDLNRTTIAYALYLDNGTAWFQQWGSQANLTIDGSTLLSMNQQISLSGANSSYLLASGTRNITHNADGTKTINFSAWFETNSKASFTPQGRLNLSGSLTLTTIPRASSVSRSHASRALGEAVTISISRASTAFTHTLRYRVGSGSYITLATGVATSHIWTLPNIIANSLPSSTSGTITIECITYNGSTEIGRSTTTLTATIPDNATFQPNASITNIDPINALGGEAVQGKSSVRVRSSRSGNFGASITETRVTIDGSNLYGTDVTSGVINKSGTISISLRVTDSRGYRTTISSSIVFQPYYSPVISVFSANRSPDEQGTNLSVAINFDIAPVANQNSRYYRVRYRPTGGSWVTLFESSSYYSRSTTHSATGVLSTENSYEVELYVADWYTSVTRTVNIGTTFVLVDYNQSGRALAFGKVSEMAEGFEVDVPSIVYKSFEFKQSPTLNGDLLLNLMKKYFLTNSGTYYNYQVDLNDFVAGDSGLVMVTTTNFPSGLGYSGFGYVETQNQYGVTNNDLIQFIFPFHGNGTPAYRTKNNSNIWSDWIYEWTSGNVETGSNSNGKYIKFPNGWMICTNEEVASSGSISATTATGVLYRSGVFTWTYPATFSEEPAVKGYTRYVSGSFHSLYVTEYTLRNHNAEMILTSTQSLSGITYRVGAIAIGRWK